MPAERNAFRLGLALIMFFTLFLGVLWFLAPRGGGDMTLTVRYPHDQFATVLKPGGEVLCAGKNVGSIRKLELQEIRNDETSYSDCYAVVTFTVESSLNLRKDCRIEPTEALLGGMGALVIRDRGLGEPAKAGQMLDGSPVMALGDLTRMIGNQLDPKNPAGLLAIIQTQLDASNAKSLLGKIHTSLNDINVMTRNVAGEFDPQQKQALLAKLHDILANVNDTTRLLREQMDGAVNTAAMAKVHQVLDTLNTSLVSVRGMLEDNREPVRRTVEHVEATSRILEQQIAAKLAEQLDTSNAAGLLTRIHVAVERLGHSLEDVNKITGDVQEVVALNKNNLDQMIGNLRETSDHLKAGSKEIRLNPWLLLYTPTQDEVAQTQLFGTARAFSDAASRLDNAISRLQAISERGKTEYQDSAAQREEIERIRAELKDTFEKFTVAEQKLWEQLNIK